MLHGRAAAGYPSRKSVNTKRTTHTQKNAVKPKKSSIITGSLRQTKASPDPTPLAGTEGFQEAHYVVTSVGSEHSVAAPLPAQLGCAHRGAPCPPGLVSNLLSGSFKVHLATVKGAGWQPEDQRLSTDLPREWKGEAGCRKRDSSPISMACSVPALHSKPSSVPAGQDTRLPRPIQPSPLCLLMAPTQPGLEDHSDPTHTEFPRSWETQHTKPFPQDTSSPVQALQGMQPVLFSCFQHTAPFLTGCEVPSDTTCPFQSHSFPLCPTKN